MTTVQGIMMRRWEGLRRWIRWLRSIIQKSLYTYCYSNPINCIEPNGKDGIYIAFPDYKISTPIGKIGNLGHAGVLLIDNKTGVTKYYEYGRYDKEGKGIMNIQYYSNEYKGWYSSGDDISKNLPAARKYTEYKIQSKCNGNIRNGRNDFCG